MLFLKHLFQNKCRLPSFIVLIAALAAIIPAQTIQASSATISVFACEPEWAALSMEIGGDTVSVYSATTASQDPHHIQARPRLIAQARKADLLICSGAELEVGWLPILLKKSGNPHIQPNASGHLMAADHVELLGKVERVTRSMGHIHGKGNPHVHLDPDRLLKVAQELTQRLSVISPENSGRFQQNLVRLEGDIEVMKKSNQQLIESLRGKQWIVHHDNWVYLNEWLELQQVATLESKPGIPPTTRHLKKLIETVESSPVAAVAYGSYQSPKAAKWLTSRTKLPLIAAPYTVSEWQAEGALSKWYASLLNTLSNGLNK